jgi:hypothetical protein
MGPKLLGYAFQQEEQDAIHVRELMTCAWTFAVNNLWQTECGRAFWFSPEFGDIVDATTELTYCPYCGGTIKREEKT